MKFYTGENSNVEFAQCCEFKMFVASKVWNLKTCELKKFRKLNSCSRSNWTNVENWIVGVIWWIFELWNLDQSEF